MQFLRQRGTIGVLAITNSHSLSFDKLITLSSGSTLLNETDELSINFNKKGEIHSDVCGSILQILSLDLDRRRLEHNITFSAQNVE